MPAITSEQIKELRERTGVGMGKCKEALEEAKGDMEAAISILRKAGMASAVKKQGRETKEGQISFKETDSVVAIAEINAETDFVVKNDRFQEFCKNIIEEAAAVQPASLDVFLQQKYSKDPSLTIDQYRSLIIQTIGENIQISRVAVWKKAKDHSVGIYSHLGGKILTCVELSVAGEQELARDIAMHVAAASPEYLSPKDVPQEIIEKEREIGRSQVQGKPANIVDKIVEGKVNAYFDMACLVKQKYIRDTSKSVEAYVKERSSGKGKEIAILRFLRWMVGQSL
jgi:elongation factor Ts